MKNTGILLAKIKKLTKTRNLVKFSAKSELGFLRYRSWVLPGLKQMAFSHRIWAPWVGVGAFLGQMRAACGSWRWVVVKGRPVLFFVFILCHPPPPRGYIALIIPVIIPVFWAALPV